MFGKKKQIKRETLSDLLNNIAFLTSVGFTPLRAVQAIVGEDNAKRKDKTADEMAKAAVLLVPTLRYGGSLGEAFAEHDDFFRNIAFRVSAGERSGKLSESLRRIAVQIKKGSEIKGKIRSAMVYPMAILILTVVITWYLFAKLLPEIFDSMQEVVTVDMPGVTVALLHMVDFFNKYGWIVFGGLALAIAVTVYLAKGPMKVKFHKFYSRLPLIGQVIRDTSAVDYYDALNFTLFAGVPMVEAMEAAALSVNNLYLRQQLQDATEIFESTGCSLADALYDTDIMTEMELETIHAGYMANRLNEVFVDLAARRELTRVQTIDRSIAMIEPITMAIAGTMVGIIAIAVYTPLMNFGTVSAG